MWPKEEGQPVCPADSAAGARTAGSMLSSIENSLSWLLQAPPCILQAGPPATPGKQQPHAPAKATQGQGGGQQAKPSFAKSHQQAAVSKDSEVPSEQQAPKAGRSKPATLPPATPTTVKQLEARQSPFGLLGAGPLQAGLRSLSGRLRGALAGKLLGYCRTVFFMFM